MSETSLNAKCRIKGFSSFQNNLARELGYIGAFFAHKLPWWNKYPKTRTNEPSDMVVCIYKGDLSGKEIGSWTQLGYILFFWLLRVSWLGFRIPEFFKCLKYWETDVTLL